MIPAITSLAFSCDGHDQIRRDFSAGRDQLGDMMKEGIEKLEKIVLEQSPAQPRTARSPYRNGPICGLLRGGDDDITRMPEASAR